MEEAFGCQSHDGWHRQCTESEEILLSGETESIRMGEDQERKPRTSGKCRSRVM